MGSSLHSATGGREGPPAVTGMGKLADMYGKKRLLMIVLAGTVVGSALSAMASTFRSRIPLGLG